MTIIYYSMPGYGHILPTLNVARELAKRGHRVIYYSTNRFKSLIEDAGVIYKEYKSKEEFPDPNISRDVGFLINTIAKFADQSLDNLIKEAALEKPDCIMHDCLAISGKIVAHNLNIPAVSIFTSAVFNKGTLMSYPKLYSKILLKSVLSGRNYLNAYITYTRLAKKYSVKLDGFEDIVMSKEKLNIVFSLPEFNTHKDVFDKSYQFVGPSLYPRPEKGDWLSKIPQNKKIIYISYGTVLNDDPLFFKICMDAFKNTSYQVIISLGDRFDPSDFPNPPKNIIIKKYVSQLEILKRASLFITHAGMNSTTEGLYYGVPMILIPGIEEQNFNALRVKEMGAGIILNKRNLTSKKLLEAVEKTINDPIILKKLQAVQKSFQKAGGYKIAADEIISYVKSC